MTTSAGASQQPVLPESESLPETGSLPEAGESARPPVGVGYWLAVGMALLMMGAAMMLTTANPLSAAILGTPSALRPELVYVADLDFWQRTPRETNVAATAYFDLDHNLNDVPMQVGDWVGVDKPEENQEVMILLEPEQYVQRLYENSNGQRIWLTMVGGRNSQPFHAPDICYDADGWQYSLGSRAVSLAAGGEIHGLYLHAHKFLPQYNSEAEHVVFYFYLFPNEGRTLDDGIVLFKLTSNRTGTVEETLALQENFIRNLFTQAGRDLEPMTPPLITAQAFNLWTTFVLPRLEGLSNLTFTEGA